MPAPDRVIDYRRAGDPPLRPRLPDAKLGKVSCVIGGASAALTALAIALSFAGIDFPPLTMVALLSFIASPIVGTPLAIGAFAEPDRRKRLAVWGLVLNVGWPLLVLSPFVALWLGFE